MVRKKVKKSAWEWVKEQIKQRRVWAAGMSGVSMVFAVLGYWQVVLALNGIAAALGLHSYIKPKK